MKTRYPKLLGLLILFGMLLAACGAQAPAPTAPPPNVIVVQIPAGSNAETAQAAGAQAQASDGSMAQSMQQSQDVTVYVNPVPSNPPEPTALPASTTVPNEAPIRLTSTPISTYTPQPANITIEFQGVQQQTAGKPYNYAIYPHPVDGSLWLACKVFGLPGFDSNVEIPLQTNVYDVLGVPVYVNQEKITFSYTIKESYPVLGVYSECTLDRITWYKSHLGVITVLPAQ